MVRIGFVGVGNMGQAAHLRNYCALGDCRVVAIAEPRPELARRVAARYELPRIYSDAESMIAHEKLDGLVVCQPFERHGSIVLPLYRHGLPIFTEKPLASSLEMAEQMVEELGRYGSWHMVGYHKRNDPAVRWALSALSSEEIEYVRVTMPPGDWISGGFDELIRSEEAPPEAPSDQPLKSPEYLAFVNYYIHQVNLLRLFLGPYRVVFGNEKVLVAENEAGVTGVIEMAPYTTEAGWDEEVLVGVSEGCLRITLPAPLVSGFCGTVELRRKGGVVRPVLPSVSAMRMQAANFVAALRGEEKPACEAAEALEDLRIAEQWLVHRGA